MDIIVININQQLKTKLEEKTTATKQKQQYLKSRKRKKFGKCFLAVS